MPFENAPDPKFFYESKGHKEASVRLAFAIETRKAMALITGDYGSGKTIMCQSVKNRLHPNNYRIAFVSNPHMDSLDITREIAYQLGEDIATRSKYEVLHALNNLLERHYGAGRHCVVVIDEAQVIGESSVLEDLRLLLNHQIDGHFLMTLVLVGQTELNDMLRPIPQMTQRIGLRYQIPHLDLDEVAPYMAHRLKMAGGTLDIFADDAIHEVAKQSKGNPREINALCDMGMLTCSLQGLKQVTSGAIMEAAKERT
ncbi:MAG: AAA family ATPase [Lentisphaerae bacterium]|nr:AAA family ATPase [Lentisphaerota bacterium]